MSASSYTSILGHAAGLAARGSHAWLRQRSGPGPLSSDYRQHPIQCGLVVRGLVSALVWTLPGMSDFVTLTLVANSAQVVLLPLLAGGLFRITSSARFIGPAFRNRPHENLRGRLGEARSSRRFNTAKRPTSVAEMCSVVARRARESQ